MLPACFPGFDRFFGFLQQKAEGVQRRRRRRPAELPALHGARGAVAERADVAHGQAEPGTDRPESVRVIHDVARVVIDGTVVRERVNPTLIPMSDIGKTLPKERSA